ncbi:MAG: hypothetical protein NC548_44490 [Lachnospiraceae bacterium]|nr:hypothetical protein [Lachnospiraceae bacterium]
MRNIYINRLSSGTTTRQRRFYILITALVCSMGVRDGYGTYYNETLIEVGFSSKFCGTINDDMPCAICGNGGQDLCRPDNACGGAGHKNYKSGDYFNVSLIEHADGGYYVCDEAGSGWVHTTMVPSTCDANTCKSSGWSKYNDTTEVMTARWCEKHDTYSSSCMATTRYQCIKNYYGYQEGEGNPITCNACPSSPDPIAKKNQDGTYTSTGKYYKGYTDDKGANYISDCLISAVGGSGGAGYIDNTGVYHFTTDCSIY